MEPTFYLRRPRVQHHENSEERSGESPRSLKARDLGSPAVHQIEDQQCSPAPGDYFISDFAGLAALPFNSITITSIPLSLVFSGKWISAALYCASPALTVKFFVFPSRSLTCPFASVRNSA